MFCYTRDYFRRIAKAEYNTGNSTVLSTEYSYKEVNSEEADETRTTLLLDAYTNEYGNRSDEYTYQYDSNGNIVKITKKESTKTPGSTSLPVIYERTYEYDELNQLVCEKTGNTKIEYQYDDGGNILFRRYYIKGIKNSEYELVRTDSYSYGNSLWRDQLTSFNGNSITYDTMGNPLQYYDGKVFEWSYGRLTGYTDSSNNTVSYQYNSDGIRTEKEVNGNTVHYVVSGATILEEYSDDYSIIFEYDISGKPVSFVYNNSRYIYLSNGFGDITGITDSNGNLVAEYEYEGYGNCTVNNLTSADIGDINPLRFKGYYLDNESGLEKGIQKCIDASKNKSNENKYNKNKPHQISNKRLIFTLKSVLDYMP